MIVMNGRVLAQLIKQQRIAEGFTQAELSKTCGVSVSQLSRVERVISFPSANFLMKVAGPLNINLTDLLTSAAYVALNEPKVRDKLLCEITGALKLTLTNNHHESRDEKPVGTEGGMSRAWS